MKLSDVTKEQLDKLIDVYADRSVLRMSLKEMEGIIYDILVENMSMLSKEAVIDTIRMEFSNSEIEAMMEEITEWKCDSCAGVHCNSRWACSMC